jgi:hypothetical protein
MTLSIPATEFNKRLSDLLRNSGLSNELLISSRVVFWRLVGLGTLALGLGAAVGLACGGYAYVARNSVNVTAVSEILAKALDQAKLTGVAEGTLQVDPHEISLAKGQTISLDPTATISLDPKSAIKVDGQIELQAPSISIPQGAGSSPPQRISTISNFTVFKRVAFQNGVIMTGWNFLTSNQPSPSDQYCYYSESGDNSNYSVSIDIAHDQQLSAPKASPNGFDILAAFNRCVWFNGANP